MSSLPIILTIYCFDWLIAFLITHLLLALFLRWALQESKIPYFIANISNCKVLRVSWGWNLWPAESRANMRSNNYFGNIFAKKNFAWFAFGITLNILMNKWPLILGVIGLQGSHRELSPSHWVWVHWIQPVGVELLQGSQHLAVGQAK